MLRIHRLLHAALVAASLVSVNTALAQEEKRAPSPEFCTQLRNAHTPAERRALMHRMQDIHGVNEPDGAGQRRQGRTPGAMMDRRAWRAMYEMGCLNEGAYAAAPVQRVQRGVAYVSGGVGQDEADAMRSIASDYNVRLVFVEKGGEYLSDVDTRIRSADGAVLLAVISEGPLLYVRLPRGKYRVSASYNGVVQQTTVTAPAHGHGAVMRTLAWPRHAGISP